MSIEVHIFDRAQALGHARGTLDLTARRAAEDMVQRCGLDAVDIALHPTDFGADRPEVSAFAMGPHNIHVGIELSRLDGYDIQTAFYRLMIHALHHCLRWRHVPRWTVAEVIVLEGLAFLADEAMAGPPDTPQAAPADPPRELDLLRRIGVRKVENNRDWLYAPDTEGAPFRAATVGRYVMDRALRQLALDPFEAATQPAETLVAAGLSLSERISE